MPQVHWFNLVHWLTWCTSTLHGSPCSLVHWFTWCTGSPDALVHWFMHLVHRRKNQGGTGGMCPPKFHKLLYKLLTTLCVVSDCAPPPPIKKSFLRLCGALVHWFTWCTGALVHLVHWLTGSPGALVDWFTWYTG